VNLAVSGATTSTLIAQQLPEALEILAARNGDRSAANDVEAITLDIGGNDVFPLVQVCGAGATPECIAAAQQRLSEVAANLALVLGTLRAAAPGTPIVVTTYYNPLPGCVLAPLAPVADIVLEGGGVLPLGLNGLIRTTAAAHDVAVADLYGALDADDWVGGQDCLHPDDSGHAIIAGLVAAAVED
jgi:lysophospholipase L1-like esterase